MTPKEKEELASLIAGATVQALNLQRGGMEIHEEEHAWLRERIVKEKSRAEFYRKVSQAVFGTVIAAFLLWVGAQGLAFVQFIAHRTTGS